MICKRKIQQEYTYCPYCGKYCSAQESYNNYVKKEIRSTDEIKYKILCCLKEIKCNTGRSLLCEILKGYKSESVCNTKTYENKYYGIFQSFYSNQIRLFIDQYIQEGYIEIYKSELAFHRPLVRLTSKGEQFLIEYTKNQKQNDVEQEDNESDSETNLNKEKILDKGHQKMNPDEPKTEEVFVKKDTYIKLKDAFDKRDKKRTNDYKNDG